MAHSEPLPSTSRCSSEPENSLKDSLFNVLSSDEEVEEKDVHTLENASPFYYAPHSPAHSPPPSRPIAVVAPQTPRSLPSSPPRLPPLQYTPASPSPPPPPPPLPSYRDSPLLHYSQETPLIPTSSPDSSPEYSTPASPSPAAPFINDLRRRRRRQQQQQQQQQQQEARRRHFTSITLTDHSTVLRRGHHPGGPCHMCCDFADEMTFLHHNGRLIRYRRVREEDD